MTSILIVDDETAVTDLLAYNLRKAHYQVLVATDGTTALELAETESPDLILLDLMLPKIDGLDVCRELRKHGEVPIIMITALGEETDRVVGLELGADDYICKPFSVRELMARVKAVLRRTHDGKNTETSDILNGPNGLQMDKISRTSTVKGKTLNLTRLEFDLLFYLMNHRGQALSREMLLEEAWGFDYPGEIRAVDSAVKRLRSKLKNCSDDDHWIETIRGIGYRFRR